MYVYIYIYIHIVTYIHTCMRMFRSHFWLKISGSMVVLQKVSLPGHLGDSRKTWWLEHRKSCTRYGRQFNRQILCDVVLKCKSDRGKLATCNFWVVPVGNRLWLRCKVGRENYYVHRLIAWAFCPRPDSHGGKKWKAFPPQAETSGPGSLLRSSSTKLAEISRTRPPASSKASRRNSRRGYGCWGHRSPLRSQRGWCTGCTVRGGSARSPTSRS